MSYKKSIAFFCCTNGYGHYKRVFEVSKHLIGEFDITIYCTKEQAAKIGKLPNAQYIYYKYDNIRWDKITSKEVTTFKEFYLKWASTYGPESRKYDIVISDNIVELLTYRSDVILMGSFLWKDVVKSYLGNNSLSTRDEWLLKEYNPTLITNKYVETQSVREYTNKVQTGFGCIDRQVLGNEIEHVVLQYPSLNYLTEYSEFLDSILDVKDLGTTKDLSYINDTLIVARPGVGTITHCVEYSIPLIALYSDNDSEEIKELAQIVEDLHIGFKQNINTPVDFSKIKQMKSNKELYFQNKFDKNGYLEISKFIKSLA